jgi:hypothetical protein
MLRQKVTRGWQYATDFGEHARWGDQKVKDFVDSMIATYKNNRQEGFDFSPEIEKSLASARPFIHDSKTFYDIDPYGFFGGYARTVPESFANLF